MAASSFQEEFEEDEAALSAKQQAAVNAQLLVGTSGALQEAGGLQLRVRPQGKTAAAGGAVGGGGKPVNSVAAAAAAALIKEFSSSAGAGKAEGIHGSSGSRQPVVSSIPTVMTGYKKRAADLIADLAADAKVAADLALLSSVSDGRRAMELEEADGALGGDGVRGASEAWVPPADQRGDGRTAANDKFGY